MPVCPSCGRASPEGDVFCPGCGRELPKKTAPAPQADGPLVVATFGPTTGWVGKTISYENQQFVLQGVGPLAAEAILELDRQGHLLWAYAGLREWVQGLVAAPAQQTATAATPQAAPVVAAQQAATAAAPQVAPATPAQQVWLPAESRPGGFAPAGSAAGGGWAAAAGEPSSAGRGRTWVLPTALLVGLAVVAVLATILEGGYVRDGAGIAFALMAVTLVVLVIWTLVSPQALRPRRPRAASSSGASLRLPAILAGLCVASFALAAVLWLMPHYEVIVPRDKRVLLDATPTLTVKVKNRGLFPGTYAASYKLAGQEQSEVHLRLSPGQERPLTLALPAHTATGAQTLQLGAAEILAEVLRPARFRVGALEVDPTIVKIRQQIRVRAAVENAGDVSGTFAGVMEANGREVEAQPTEIAAGKSVTLTFSVAQDAAGACRLQLGEARKTVMVVRPTRPGNGHLLRRSAGGGRAHLTIKNTNALDAMVILTRSSAPQKPVLAVYVRRKSTATVENVPDGRYIVWDCTGSDWNAYMQDFLTTEEHVRWHAPLVFSTSSSTNYWSDASYNYSQKSTNWTNWTLTLGSGRSKYSSLTSAQRFPRL